MDNSQLVFCRVQDIDLMNEANEEHDMDMLENFEYCEYCLGAGSIEIDREEYECEYCDIIYDLYSSDSDSDSDYVPDWSEDNDTDEDTYSCCSEESDCGEVCNDNVCFCGSV